MSDIKVSERAESKLRAQHHAYYIRRLITAELLASFGHSEKKLEAHIRKLTEKISDPEQRKVEAAALKELEENFEMWFIEKERDRLLEFTSGISEHLRAANTIWPTYMSEFEERRLEMDRALVCCNKLQDELQYIAETLPADKNRYMAIVLEVEKEFEMIKALRQSDNRFLKHLKK